MSGSSKILEQLRAQLMGRTFTLEGTRFNLEGEFSNVSVFIDSPSAGQLRMKVKAPDRALINPLFHRTVSLWDCSKEGVPATFIDDSDLFWDGMGKALFAIWEKVPEDANFYATPK